MKFLKRHGQLLLIFAAFTEIIMFLYLKVDEDRPVIKPEQTIRNIVLNIPKIPEPKKEEKKEERVEKQVEDKKTNIPIPELKAKAKEKKIEIFEENKKIQKEIEKNKAQENVESPPVVNYKETMKGGEKGKGFPIFYCDELLDKREFLSGLHSLGINEFIVLINGKEVKGVLPFNSREIGSFKKKEPSVTGGFQRLISQRDAVILGLKIDGDLNVGFYLPAKPVEDALKSYMANHGLNYKPEDLNGFRCKYSNRGFEVVGILK